MGHETRSINEMRENEYHWRRGGFKTPHGKLVPIHVVGIAELLAAINYFSRQAERFSIRLDFNPLERELDRRGYRGEYRRDYFDSNSDLHRQNFNTNAFREAFIPDFKDMQTKKTSGTTKKAAPKKVTKKDGVTKMFISINTDSQVKKWEDIAERVNDNMEGNIHLTIEEATEAKDKDYDYFYVVEVDIKSVKSDRITSAINLMDVKLS